MTSAAALRDRDLLAASWRAWLSMDNARGPGPWWLPWLWTALFCIALALLFTAIGLMLAGPPAWRVPERWPGWFGRNLVVSVVVGIVIHLMFDAARLAGYTGERLRRWQPWQRTALFVGLPATGVAIGWPLGMLAAGFPLLDWVRGEGGGRLVATMVAISLVMSFAIHHWAQAKTAEHEAVRRATEAQLRLLQAQIEPHFLFNTLANVISLIDHDAPLARRTLESFTDYLRATLGALRREDSTLGAEVELARAYLDLVGTRMGDRLQVALEVDPALAAHPLPPLLLQPLVENAVVHGLEPTVEGGRVTVRARAEAGRLVLEVHDTGRGLDAPPRPGRHGSGLAVANLRERLQGRWGTRATLDLQPASPGTRATVRLPLAAVPPAASAPQTHA